MQMGLHRCDTWLRTGGIFPGDLERSWAINLFWCIYVFDKEYSFETGLPFGMRDSDMDVTLPRPVCSFWGEYRRPRANHKFPLV
jgi:hypothetical protein